MATGSSSVTDFLRNALAQVGDRHRKAAEANLTDADPDAWDSSELVEWSANRAGVTINDGSWLQYRQLHRQGGQLSVEDAVNTPGALLFTFSSEPMASPERPASAGVAISLGNGQIITVAPGGAVAVVDASTRAFSHAAVMPGFADARSLDAEGRQELTDLFAEHQVRALGHDPVDPDGDGVPLSPDEADRRVLDLRRKADEIRKQAEEAETRHDRHDADLEAARAVFESRRADAQLQVENVERASRAVAEAQSDFDRASVEYQATGQRIVELRHRLGLPVPSDELLRPDGNPTPAPPPPETDPTTIEQLRGELIFAEAELDALAADLEPFERAVLQRDTERDAAQRLADAAAAAVKEQEEDVARLRAPEETADDLLINARALEAEAADLERRADEVSRRWDAFEQAHPDRPATDLGEIVVEASGAEAFALGRRERAGELEAEAATAERESDAAERGAADRTELADLKDERADDLRARADGAAAKATQLDAEIRQATEQMHEWSATAEKRSADAARLRQQGRTEDADVMATRAQQADRQWIAHSSRVDELKADQATLRSEAEAWRAEATALAGQADLLDEEAAALSKAASDADGVADSLQERAAAQDRYADQIDEALSRGVETELHIVDQDEAIDVKVPIPGRDPFDDTLGAPSDATPPAVIEQVPVPDEPASALPPEPEPDLTEQLFAGLEGGDGLDG
jgi:hypothetical protein